MLRRLVICISFATCCFLNTWVELAEGDGRYFARWYPLREVVMPVLAWEAILTLGGLLLWRMLDGQIPSRVTSTLFLAASCFPAGIVSVAALRLLPFSLAPIVHAPLFVPVALLIFASGLCFCLLHPQRAAAILQETLLYSTPVLALIVFQAARKSLWPYTPAMYADRVLAPTASGPPPRARLVWIIFDELSQQIVFGNRPAGLSLPNFDRLRSQSFYASSASAPSNSTELSLPALVVGEPVTRAVPDGPDNLLIRAGDNSALKSWGSMRNVFDDARSAGYNTAITGWFHPYGRLLEKSLNHCFWTAGWMLSGIEEGVEQQTLASGMWDRARLQFAVIPLVGHIPGVFPGVYARQAKVQKLQLLLQHAREMAADPSIGLLLIHLPVPHPPAIYSRSEGTINVRARIGYVDSVSLADQILGELLESIQHAGLEKRTSILVSADHGWRTGLWRGDAEWTSEEEAVSRQDTSGVPFLLRLADQQKEITYTPRLNTVVTRRLIDAILDGWLTDPSQIQRQLNNTGGGITGN